MSLVTARNWLCPYRACCANARQWLPIFPPRNWLEFLARCCLLEMRRQEMGRCPMHEVYRAILDVLFLRGKAVESCSKCNLQSSFNAVDARLKQSTIDGLLSKVRVKKKPDKRRAFPILYARINDARNDCLQLVQLL